MKNSLAQCYRTHSALTAPFVTPIRNMKSQHVPKIKTAPVIVARDVKLLNTNPEAAARF